MSRGLTNGTVLSWKDKKVSAQVSKMGFFPLSDIVGDWDFTLSSDRGGMCHWSLVRWLYLKKRYLRKGDSVLALSVTLAMAVTLPSILSARQRGGGQAPGL